MNLFGTKDDIDWLNMHNNMIDKKIKAEWSKQSQIVIELMIQERDKHKVA